MANAKTDSGYFKVQGRIWIDSDKGPFIGFGRVQLLKKIQELGSIARAAKSMNMAYRHAWHLIDSMNNKADCPLVITQAGGKGGGGAVITEEAEKIIRTFEMLDKEFLQFLETKSKSLEL